MTVVTPGGPCLTQTQITRNENQERFEKKQEAKNIVQANPVDVTAESPSKISGVEEIQNNPQYRQSYGAPGYHSVDIMV
jgi:hypothetical protein